MAASPLITKPYIVTHPEAEGYFIGKSSQRDLKEPVRKAAGSRKKPEKMFGQLYWSLDKSKFVYRYLSDEEINQYREEGPWNKKVEENVPSLPVKNEEKGEVSPGLNMTYVFPPPPPQLVLPDVRPDRDEFEELKRLVISLMQKNESLKAQDLYYEDRINKVWEEAERLRERVAELEKEVADLKKE